MKDKKGHAPTYTPKSGEPASKFIMKQIKDNLGKKGKK